ncbi:MAG: CapA family protein, partial [Armatimonadetes bacterium]|nr:CapA family protein [Armatimonadota bacterium]
MSHQGRDRRLIARIGRLAAALAAAGVLLSQAGGVAAAPGPRPTSIVFAGDILLAGRAAELIEKEGPAAPFSGVRSVLRGAGMAIGNLECPLATGGAPVEKQYTFRAPPSTAAALVDAGFDVVTLANNHAMDYGPEALLETLATLRGWGVIPIGAGADADEARRWVLVESGRPPVKIAVLAFSNMLPKSFYAGAETPGTNPARPETMAADIAAAREQADVVVVLIHWGTELESSPSEKQRRVAAVAAEAGADLVIGHHPHVIQGLEIRGHTLIAYSLGNLLFSARTPVRPAILLRYTPPRAGGGAARRGGKVEVIPCVIEGFRPRLATAAERSDILANLTRLSKRLGAALPA